MAKQTQYFNYHLLSAKELETFKEQGFLVIKNILTEKAWHKCGKNA